MYTIRVRNVEQALPVALATLKGYGVRVERRGMGVIEMEQPVATVYERPTERVLFNPVRDANPFFHFFESLWILAGRNDVDFLEHLLLRMAQYSDDGHTFHGAYGKRLRNWDCRDGRHDQIVEAIYLLKQKPDTRQCVLSIWDPALDLGVQTKDMPCNDMIMFSRSGASFEKLNMTVCNRSNDAIWGAYGANAVQFSMLQEYVAVSVGCQVGTYTQMSNNFHVYEDNPFWQTYIKEGDQLLGHTPYYREGATAPFDLFQDIDKFNSDLYEFFRRYDAGTLDHSEWAQSVGFQQVVMPMREAFKLYKSGLLKDAWIMCNDIAAIDWGSACAEWLSRRISARVGKGEL